jgi:oxepin-CoA hydrolase/3-oxo-5,6-dehydrosuberyl-CoA semialdehyde dehydrogenase
MSAQQMIEHLEQAVLVSFGEPEAEKCFTPEENLEKWQDSLYNHRAMPKEFTAPFLPQDGSLPELTHKNLEAAKLSFMDNLKKFVIYYKENPQAEHMNFVFGKLNKEMWELMHKKHFTHHFQQFGLI